MIQKLILFVAFLFPLVGFSTVRKSTPSAWVIKDSVSTQVSKDSVKIVFIVEDRSNKLMLNQHPSIIQAKINGKTTKYTISNQRRSFALKLLKGKTDFSFFMNANFEEIPFSILLKGGHYYEVGLNFKEKWLNSPQIMLEKPVIYLYSETKQAFNLKINTESELQFTYPNYETEWVGTASPNGTIQVDSSNYPYLFWDAALPAEKLKLDWSNADQASGKEIVTYLEGELSNLGFNAKEKTDFITYWAPRMEKMKYVQLIWLQDEAINPIASLDISPNFHQNRIYLVFRETDQLFEQTMNLKVKALKPMKRKGNYLVEWGGIEITRIPNFD